MRTNSIGERPSAPEQRRFLFYSHDAIGLGHVRRNLAIARALTELAPDASVLLAASVEEVDRLGVPSNVDVLRLPGLRKVANGTYVARRLGVAAREVRALRSALLSAAVDSFRPTVILVDKHPLGAGGELREALERGRSAGARAVLGLRDILDDPATVRSEWSEYSLLERISELYDRVLVYGQRAVLDPVKEYGFSRSVARLTRFCGYVAPTGGGADGRHAGPQRLRPVVLATAGGGEDGAELLETVVHASIGAPWDALVVAGPQCGREELGRLEQESAAAGVELRAFVPGLSECFSAASAIVCMGGYNTLVEAVASRVPIVCVPRTQPRQEQLIRADAFARLGLLSVIDPSRLTVSFLRARINEALGRPSVESDGHREPVLDLAGAERAAQHLLELAVRDDLTSTDPSRPTLRDRREAVHASG